VNSLPKTVTGQRRGCDLNPGPSVPGSSTLTTRLPLCQKLTDNYLILIKSQRRLYVMRAGHLPSPQTHVPRKSQSRTSTHHTYPNTNQGVVSMIAVSRGGAGEGQRSRRHAALLLATSTLHAPHRNCYREGQVSGDKYQITGGVSAYACAEISLPP